jgi:large subunit ribosomal protein L25
MEKKLACVKRTEKKKNASGRLRKEGIIPANFIMDGKSNSVGVNEKEFTHLLNSGLRLSSLINLTMDNGENKHVVVKEIQRNPVTGKILHIDFFGAHEDKKMKVNIGIELEGSAKGVKKGGALEHYIRYVTVQSKPSDLIDTIKVNISNLDVGDSISFNDLNLNKDWNVRIDGNPVVARVAKSRLAMAEGGEKTEAAPAEAKK